MSGVSLRMVVKKRDSYLVPSVPNCFLNGMLDLIYDTVRPNVALGTDD